jgi:bifunctional DNA-binding transcriptional regulator/antitoxin component of YhaV-PrlF toxin-antitoxin module|tara:strand:- start:168 stop:347 length:180 start_codon:yes stop_codon:yes gene_type:complete
MSYFIELEEHEDGDLFLTLPEEVIETLGWETGMLLTWDVRGDGIIVQRLNSESGYEQLE